MFRTKFTHRTRIQPCDLLNTFPYFNSRKLHASGNTADLSVRHILQMLLHDPVCCGIPVSLHLQLFHQTVAEIRSKNAIRLQLLQCFQCQIHLRFAHAGLLCHLFQRCCEKSGIIQTFHHILQQIPLSGIVHISWKLIENIIFHVIRILHGNVFPPPVLFLHHLFIVLFKWRGLFVCFIDFHRTRSMISAVVQQRIFQIFILEKLVQFHTVHCQHFQ